MRTLLNKISAITSNRLLTMAALFGVLYLVLGTRLYEIQIVNGQDYQHATKTVYTNTRSVTAQRGGIYDRNGQPLAINVSAVMVKLDPTVSVSNQMEVLISLVRLLNRFGETIVDDLPISDTEPRAFLFNGSEAREIRWKKDMNLPETVTAQEAYERLAAKVPSEEWGLTPEETRAVMSMWQSLYLQRNYKNPVTVAMEIGAETLAALEERNQDYPGVFADVDYLRVYPEGKYVSHIIGYTRKITAEQLAELTPFGYKSDDVVGQLGIESVFELNLRGETGYMVMEVDSAGRRLGVLESVPAKAGNDIFLTIDIELTRSAYHILENQLRDIIISKLMTDPNKKNIRADDYLTVKGLLASMLRSNNISVTAIMNADETSLALPIRVYVELTAGLDPSGDTYWADVTEFIAVCVENGKVTENQLLLAMYEQGVVEPTGDELERMQKGTLNTLNFLVRMLEENIITPQMTNVKPCTGSIVVLDVKTGGVLASVSYPSYDNNEFANNFNYNYYLKLMNDPTVPMFNRPFQETRAVGSTFKMITAVAGLENGVINPTTRIVDEYTFTKAGEPYATCNSYHGSVNVVEALMVSCNYFFYETAYRLGNTASGTKLMGASKLSEYMVYFGLGLPTGVEIFEVADAQLDRLPEGLLQISSPEYRAYKGKTAAEKLWGDGDTIRTAIGQADNALTAATMAKYVATLATGGDRYKMHFMDKIVSYEGATVAVYKPEIELTVPMSASTVNAISSGMLAVTTNSKGTGYKIFQDFPVTVAGKTGTAQESQWPNHTTFAGYAPYDDPQVAIYVLMPGSYQTANASSQTVASPATIVARDVLAAYFKLDAQPQKADKDNMMY